MFVVKFLVPLVTMAKVAMKTNINSVLSVAFYMYDYCNHLLKMDMKPFENWNCL